MTQPADASLQALADLVVRVTHTLRAVDTPAARAEAAAAIDQLWTLASAAERQRPPGAPAVFDDARVVSALAVFADWLRAPTPASEARAQQAMAELQAMLSPLVGVASAGAEDARREQYRQDARAAIDDYFRANPIKPFKPEP